MIKNSRTRRRLSLGLLVSGAVLLLLAPENAWIGLAFVALGLLLEVLGIWLGHADKAER
jgi:hypothetical protein